jgi:hypothetical protein
MRGDISGQENETMADPIASDLTCSHGQAVPDSRWICEGDDVDIALWEIERRGCPRAVLLPFLNGIRWVRSVPLEIRSFSRKLVRASSRAKRRLSGSGSAGQVTEEVRELAGLAVELCELYGRAFSPKELRAAENWMKAQIVAVIRNETRGTAPHSLVAALFDAVSPSGANGRMKNTQVIWARRHRKISAAEAMAGLDAVAWPDRPRPVVLTRPLLLKLS